jgi:hypothetical protein
MLFSSRTIQVTVLLVAVVPVRGDIREDFIAFVRGYQDIERIAFKAEYRHEMSTTSGAGDALEIGAVGAYEYSYDAGNWRVRADLRAPSAAASGQETRVEYAFNGRVCNILDHSTRTFERRAAPPPANGSLPPNPVLFPVQFLVDPTFELIGLQHFQNTDAFIASIRAGGIGTDENRNDFLRLTAHGMPESEVRVYINELRIDGVAVRVPNKVELHDATGMIAFVETLEYLAFPGRKAGERVYLPRRIAFVVDQPDGDISMAYQAEIRQYASYPAFTDSDFSVSSETAALIIDLDEGFMRLQDGSQAPLPEVQPSPLAVKNSPSRVYVMVVFGLIAVIVALGWAIARRPK